MIESVIWYNIALWWSTIRSADKAAINRICKQVTNITKTDISNIDGVYVKYVITKLRMSTS